MPAQTSIEATSIAVKFLTLIGQRLLANLPAQTSIEATSISTNTTSIGRAGLGPGKASERTLIPNGGAEARFGYQGSQGVLGGFHVLLTTDVFALGCFAPVSAG